MGPGGCGFGRMSLSGIEGNVGAKRSGLRKERGGLRNWVGRRR